MNFNQMESAPLSIYNQTDELTKAGETADLLQLKDDSVATIDSNDIMNTFTNSCLCGQPDDSLFMIVCDVCSIWYHGRCTGIF